MVSSWPLVSIPVTSSWEPSDPWLMPLLLQETLSRLRSLTTSISTSMTSAPNMLMSCPEGPSSSRKSMVLKMQLSSKTPASSSSPSMRISTHGTILLTHCHQSHRKRFVTCISSSSPPSDPSSALPYQNMSHSATLPVSTFSSTPTSKKTTKIALTRSSSRAPTPGFRTLSVPMQPSRTGTPLRCLRSKDSLLLLSRMNALIRLSAMVAQLPSLESTRRTRSILIIYLQRRSRFILKPCLTSYMKPTWPLKQQSEELIEVESEKLPT